MSASNFPLVAGTVVLLLAAFAAAAPASSVPPSLLFTSSKIEPEVIKSFLANNGRATVMVTMKDRVEDLIDNFDHISFDNEEEKVALFVENLKKLAQRSQREILNFLRVEQSNGLDNPDLVYRPLYVSNVILVKNASKQVIHKLAKFPQVAKISTDDLSLWFTDL